MASCEYLVPMSASSIKALSLLAAFALFGAGSDAAAADAASKPLTAPPALSDVKPIPPSRSELPDAAFKKLDIAGKGYVTRDDTHELDGFDAVFERNDRNHDGRLDPDEFKRAWAMYAGPQ